MRSTAKLVRGKWDAAADRRLAELALATGRTKTEVIRLLVMQARVDPQPDIVLTDGRYIVRIRRQAPGPGSAAGRYTRRDHTTRDQATGESPGAP